MRAWVGRALGPISGYALEQIDDPVLGERDLRVRVEAVGLGFVDALIMQGRYQVKPALPFVPGGEIVGTIQEVGPEANQFAPGQRIAAWQFGGGLGDQAIIDARDAVVVPDGVDPAIAAASLLDFLTAHYGLFDRGGLAEGMPVLVTGASGGVGSAAIRIASAMRARPIGLAGDPDKQSYAQDCGAELVLDYRDPDWRAQLKSAFPLGVARIFDPVGGALFEPGFRCLAKRGRHLVVGFAGGADIPRLPANLVLLKSAELVGVDTRHLWHTDKRRMRMILSALLGMVAAGRIAPRIAVRAPLEETARAFASLADRDRLGKVVVEP